MRIVTRIVPQIMQAPDAFAVVARCYLQASCLQNRMLLRARIVPPLYGSGVRFEPEPRWLSLIDRNGYPLGFEEFATGLDVHERGWGDCDDLAPLICAERQETCDCGHWFHEHRRAPRAAQVSLGPRHPFQTSAGHCTRCDCARFRGELADLFIVYKTRRCPRTGRVRPSAHAAVRRENGTVEDPSRYLGM
jgi:hypothetical protein